MRLIACFSALTILSPCKLPAQDLAARADSVMRAAQARGFSGVVRLVKDGSLVLEKGYGLANRVKNIPFTRETVVQIGSNTKDFTAVSILQLQSRKLLSVNDSLGKFFPSAPSDKQGITILQLMNHRAGFPLGLGSDYDAQSRQSVIDAAMKFKLLFPPGSRQSYSNTGYALLAAIIERLSGKTYDEYVRDNILTPLGLTHTGFLLPHFDERRLAHGYGGNGEDAGTMLSRPHAADGPYWNLRGNGGMLSTLSDMHVFYEALFDSDRLLSRADRGSRFNPSEPVALAGSDLIDFFLYERDPQSKVEMIIASNNSEAPAPVARHDLARLLGLPVPGENGVREERSGGDSIVRRKGTPPSAAVASVIRGLVAALNKGDNAALRAFIADNFASGAGSPTPEERLARIGGIHAIQGVITIVEMNDFSQGPVEVTMGTEKEGGGLLLVDIDHSAPYRIRRLGIQIGGD